MSQERAWGWVAALRSGATTPWQEWSGEAEPAPGPLPGAQQLALLHRLNVAAHDRGRTVPPETADRVLAAGVSGRGRGDLPLLGAEAPHRFGLRPVDPDTLADDELLRVAAGLVADDVAATVDDPEPERTVVERVRSLRRPWARPFVVVGIPWRAEAIREDLAAQGHRQGGRRPTAYLLADDLGQVVADAWTARAFDQGGPTWSEFLYAFGVAGHLPPRADLARMARSASHKFGKDNVRIVFDRDLLAAELGVRSIAGPPRLDAPAVDLVRRVGEPLGLLVPGDVRPPLLRSRLLGRLSGPTGTPLAVPARWDTWLRTQAERTRHDLAAAGYPVLGDLDRLVPAPAPDDPGRPIDAEVLALALGLLLDPVNAPKIQAEEAS